MQGCIIRLSINKDLKLEKRKGGDKQGGLEFYTMLWSRDYNCLLSSAAIYHFLAVW